MVPNILGCARRGLILAALPLATLNLGTEAAAQQSDTKAQYAKEIGASERVNFSGKLRMLSQKIVATSCNYAAGIDAEASGPAMLATQAEFDLIIDALANGNPDLGIHGEEKRKKTRLSIAAVNDQWAPISSNISAIDSQDKGATMVSVAEQSAPLLEQAKLLVSDLSSQYSDPSVMTQANAILVDISGRQRMLTQRMSKNVCLVASGINPEQANSELAATAEMFKTSLFALSNGMPAAGVNPPPNSQIADGLKVVIANWTALEPFVLATLAGESLDAADRATVFHGMNQMTANMNKVVGLYSEASKQAGSM